MGYILSMNCIRQRSRARNQPRGTSEPLTSAYAALNFEPTPHGRTSSTLIAKARSIFCPLLL